MPRNYLFRVALWQIPTMVVGTRSPESHEEECAQRLELNALNNLHFQDRCRLLESQLELADMYFRSQPPPANTSAIDVFVAPEYLFSESDKVHFVSEDSKDRLLTLIKGLSERFPQMIIIPGTVAWKKPALRSGYFKLGWSRGKRAAKRRTASGGQIDARSRDKFQRARDSGDPCYLAENTSYIHRNGKVILKYHKRKDGGEVSFDDGDDVFWVPGNRESVFAVEGVQFGLQICAENCSQLKQTVDVQVVIAASNRLKTASANIVDNGYVFYVDAINEPGVYCNQAGANQLQKAPLAPKQRGVLASPLTNQEIAKRVADAQTIFPATATKSGGVVKSAQENADKRTASTTTQLSGRVYYYSLPFVK